MMPSFDWRLESTRILIGLALTSLLALAINSFVVLYSEWNASEGRYARFEVESQKDKEMLRASLAALRGDTDVVSHTTGRLGELNETEWWSGGFLVDSVRRAKCVQAANDAVSAIADDIETLQGRITVTEAELDSRESGIEALQAEMEMWLTLHDIADAAGTAGRRATTVQERATLRRDWAVYRIKWKKYVAHVVSDEAFNRLKGIADGRIARFHAEGTAAQRRDLLAFFGAVVSVMGLWIAITALLPKPPKTALLP